MYAASESPTRPLTPKTIDERHQRLLPLLRHAANEAKQKAARFRLQGNAACAEIYEELAAMRSGYLRALEQYQ